MYDIRLPNASKRTHKIRTIKYQLDLQIIHFLVTEKEYSVGQYNFNEEANTLIIENTFKMFVWEGKARNRGVEQM